MPKPTLVADVGTIATALGLLTFALEHDKELSAELVCCKNNALSALVRLATMAARVKPEQGDYPCAW